MHKLLSCLAAAALLSACSNDKNPDAAATTAEAANATLAGSLASRSELSTFGAALKDTGLAAVFDGNASYTVFAPTDDAFGNLGEPGKALLQPDARAALATVLRVHVVPGYFTPKDIAGAIDAANGKPVKMPTMGQGDLTFARSGTDLTVTSDDGVTARFAGDPVLASNGVAIPVDTVLKSAPGASASAAPAH